MKTKNFKTSDISLSLATIVIASKTKPSTHELVLSEIIKISQAYPDEPIYISNLSKSIPPKLNISPTNFRSSISYLYKHKIISRIGFAIFLNPAIKPPFSHISISQQ